MNAKRTFTLLIIATATAVPFSLLAQDGFSDDRAIKEILHENFDGRKVGMVIGLIDEHGSRVFGAGGLDNGTEQTVNGDTVFEIGSITKTFTTLLLQDMVERGEMKLDDPVAKYLPGSTKMPAYNGKEITLLDLATHTSGLPRDVTSITSRNPDNPFDYTPEQMFAFLSGWKLAVEPGTKFEYSNLGMGLLGHAIELTAKTNFESLVVDRICSPLHMNDTRAVLSPKLKVRLAIGHEASGKRAPNYDFQFGGMGGCGALRSTVNDLLKYVAAESGLTPSSLTPLMEKTQQIRHRDVPTFGKTAMCWVDTGQSEQTGLDLLGHAGGTAGYSAFIGFDRERHRGVAILFNEQDGNAGIHSQSLGWLLLERVPLTEQIVANLFPFTSSELVGIGVKLKFDQPTRTVRIDTVFPHLPAAQAGMSADLIVQQIDGVPTAGKTTEVCGDLIRGKAGTKVRLVMVNPERNETNTVELVRQKFTLPKQ